MSTCRKLESSSEILTVTIGGVKLEGELHAPHTPAEIVVIPVAGAGGYRNPRHEYLAALVRDPGVATLVCDLAGGGGGPFALESRLDVPRLAERLEAWTEAVRIRTGARQAPIGYLASEGAAAAALTVAARHPGNVHAVVAYRGRVDLAAEALPLVQCPVLLIAPGNDVHGHRINRHALRHLRCPRRLEVVAGAGALFAEPGALCRVGVRARRWLRRHVSSWIAGYPELTVLPAPRALATPAENNSSFDEPGSRIPC